MVYTSKEKEVNTAHLIFHTSLNAKSGCRSDHCKRRRESEALLSERYFCTDTSTFNVPEPIGREIPARGDDVDTIILPMHGFDRKGRRIGYGAGYYDRFLAKNRKLRRSDRFFLPGVLKTFRLMSMISLWIIS